MGSEIVGPAEQSTEAGDDLAHFLHARRHAKYVRFVFAVLGAIPWIGALLAAGAAIHAEAEQGRVNELHKRWLEEHEARIRELKDTILQMMTRLEQLGATADERVQDERYLGLVRYGFTVWNEASTKDKRERVRRILTNAAGTRLCSDDVVRIFLDWIRKYDEIHFRVIQVIYKDPGITRADVWEQVHGDDAREDSAEADLFKLLFRDLSTGQVVRQHRDTTFDGRFLSRPSGAGGKRTRAPTLKSAFDDREPYELTELGKQFVHYAMNEIVPRIGVQPDPSHADEGV